MGFNLKPIPADIYGKKIILRVDFNIAVKKRKGADDLRLLKTLPTISFLRNKGAKVIIVSHLEKEGGCPSMRAVFNYARKKIKGLDFVGGMTGRSVSKMIEKLEPGGVLMLENLRLNPGEKKNSPVFAKSLASMADIYINEAFSVSHRSHASIVGIPDYLPSYAGFLFRDEIKNLSLAFNPPRPFTLIVGGNKLKTKIPLIKKFLRRADRVIVGGALAASFLYGKESKLQTPKITLPKDVITERKRRKTAVDVSGLGKRDIIYDLGPKSMREIAGFAKKSRFVLWNGPLGFVEKGHVFGTVSLIKALRSSKAKVVAGGGDTADFLRSRGLAGGFYFISTAGGAMLDFLVCGTLPGIEALKK